MKLVKASSIALQENNISYEMMSNIATGIQSGLVLEPE